MQVTGCGMPTKVAGMAFQMNLTTAYI